MLEWFSRYNQRQRDLAVGVDADLVQSNRKKLRISLLLISASFLFIGIDHFVKLHGHAHEIVTWIFGFLLVGGVFLGRWAGLESSFLRKPDPKEPPSLFK